MAVDVKKEFLIKVMSTTEEGNVFISSCIIYFANARKHSEVMLRGETIKYFEKVAVFYTIVFYGIILSMFLYKAFPKKNFL